MEHYCSFSWKSALPGGPSAYLTIICHASELKSVVISSQSSCACVSSSSSLKQNGTTEGATTQSRSLPPLHRIGYGTVVNQFNCSNLSVYERGHLFLNSTGTSQSCSILKTNMTSCIIMKIHRFMQHKAAPRQLLSSIARLDPSRLGWTQTMHGQAEFCPRARTSVVEATLFDFGNLNMESAQFLVWFRSFDNIYIYL